MASPENVAQHKDFGAVCGHRMAPGFRITQRHPKPTKPMARVTQTAAPLGIATNILKLVDARY
jgi:hypothetical protein